MTTKYPNQTDQFPVHADNIGEKITAQHLNDLQDAVVAIETALGVSLSAVFQVGATNSAVQKYKSLLLPTHTRNSKTTINGSGQITKYEEFDGATTPAVLTVNYTYDANGNVATTQEIAGGSTVTTTYTWNADGSFTCTRAVV